MNREIGIYINCKLRDFILLILQGAKLYETRSKNMLGCLVGQKVALIETGRGRTVVRGYATIECMHRYHRYTPYWKQACLDGTPYDAGWARCFYKLKNVEQCEPFEIKRIGKCGGQSYCVFEKEDK